MGVFDEADDWRERTLEDVLLHCRDLVEDPTFPTVARFRETGGKVLGHFQVYFPEEIAHAAGLDGKDMREQVAAGQYKHAVDERVEAAHELGVHAVPTFLFADRFAVEGAQTFETFDKVMQRVLAG